jgi:molybdate transport repressor ModE-like protein
MRFDLTDLRLFLCVIEAGSITRGATLAHMALPSASARLRGMEDVIGLPLLERNRRGVVATAGGDALAHHARMVLGQIDRMQTELREYATGRKGTIRLLTNTAAMMEFLPERLAAYLVRHPKIVVDVKERPSHDIVKAVAGELADVGIIALAGDAGALQLLPFAVDRLVAVIPRGHSLGAHRRLPFGDIIAEPMIGLVAGNPLQDYLDEHALRAGRALTFRARLRTFDGVCQMVEQGVGIAIVPETAAARCRLSMAIRTIRLTDAWATRELALCVRDVHALPAHVHELVESLVEQPPRAPARKARPGTRPGARRSS